MKKGRVPKPDRLTPFHSFVESEMWRLFSTNSLSLSLVLSTSGKECTTAGVSLLRAALRWMRLAKWLMLERYSSLSLSDVKSSHLYLYSAFNKTNCGKATAQYQNRKIVYH